jgi:L-fuculose-phosphate aldolase
VDVPAEVARQFQEVGRLLWEAGLVSSHGGNISVRLPDGRVVITCHGSMLGRLAPDDLVVLGEGSSSVAPSMDTALHQGIYAASPAGAVVHAHPRHAIALALAGEALRPRDLEGRHHLGEVVPVVARQEEVPAVLTSHAIAVVAGHGSYARGDDLWQALQLTSILEESCQIIWLLRALG